MKRIPIGISNFAEVIGEDYYYIDKSDLCREIIEELDKIAVLPRPRRFGKTLNISMLRCFFEKKKDGTSRRDLFKGLSIERWK
ncbi:MAG: AAA family ATPase, partial [Bacteroidales bacterium]|nr:AAA family ATPase [Bacteroidales bacterium]